MGMLNVEEWKCTGEELVTAEEGPVYKKELIYNKGVVTTGTHGGDSKETLERGKGSYSEQDQ